MTAVGFWTLLEDDDRAALRAVGTVLNHEPGTVLLREGDSAGVVVVLLDGQAKVTAVTSGGHEAIFAVLGAGDILGELAVLDGEPCSATVSSIGQVRCLSVPAERFLAVLDRRPHLARALLRAVTARLRASNRRQVEYGESTAARRLAALLVDLAERHGTPASGGSVRIGVQVSQYELAGLIAASREMVARALRELREQGVVATGRQRVTILHLDRLRRHAAPF